MMFLYYFAGAAVGFYRYYGIS